MSFAYPWVLVALCLIPMLALYLFVPAWRERKAGTFIFSRASSLKNQSRGLRRHFEPLPDLLVLVAMALMIVALARPQSVDAEQVEVEGIDIFVTFDMSGSMRAIDKDRGEVQQLLNRGDKPETRMEAAKRVLADFVESREHDRLGMVVFAQEAFLQFPLTLDYNTILSMLDRLKLGDIDPSGTAIGNALGRSVAGLKESEANTKIVILITDGDRRGGNISPMQAAGIAKELDVKVFPILVGRDGPTLVPVQVQGFFGKKQDRYREMEFPVNMELLEEIAAETGGEAYRATDVDGLEEGLYDILDRFERTRIRDTSNVERRELFRPFVIWAVLLLAVQLTLRFTLLRKFP